MKAISYISAFIFSTILLILLYGNPFQILELPIYFIFTPFKPVNIVFLFCFLISFGLAKKIYDVGWLKSTPIRLTLISVLIIASSYLLFRGVTSAVIKVKVKNINPDEIISTSHYSYLHRPPTLRYIYDRPSRVLILKDCDILRWSYRYMSFRSIKPNTAAVIAPYEWRKNCDWPLYSKGRRN